MCVLLTTNTFTINSSRRSQTIMKLGGVQLRTSYIIRNRIISLTNFNAQFFIH